MLIISAVTDAQAMNVDSPVGVTMSGLAGIAVLPALLIAVIGSALLWAARPWELRGGTLIDKLRIAEAVNSYDFWLTVRGISGRRRRRLRDELRANLWDATHQVGRREALRALGPTRRLARESTAEPTGPRWGRGLFAAVITLEVVVALQLLIVTAVADTALGAGLVKVDVPVTLVPGMHALYEKLPDGGFSFGANLGPTALVLALVVFLLVARPWRLARRRAVAGTPS